MYVQKDLKLKGRLPIPPPPQKKKICYFSKLRPLSIMCLSFSYAPTGFILLFFVLE